MKVNMCLSLDSFQEDGTNYQRSTSGQRPGTRASWAAQNQQLNLHAVLICTISSSLNKQKSTFYTPVSGQHVRHV